MRALNPVNSIAERASASLGSRYRPGATRYNQLFVTLFRSTSSCPSLFPPCSRCLLFCVELQRAWLFALEHSLGFTCHQPCHSPASPPHLPASPPSAKQLTQPPLSFCHSNIIHLLWRLHAPNTFVSTSVMARFQSFAPARFSLIFAPSACGENHCFLTAIMSPNSDPPFQTIAQPT